jgi:hypothetical protein
LPQGRNAALNGKVSVAPVTPLCSV